MSSRALAILMSLALALSAILWGIYASPIFFAINYSTSLKERLFVWHKNIPVTLHRDDFVFFTYKTVPDSLYFNTGERLIKKIAGLPGDTVTFTPKTHIVCRAITPGAPESCKEFQREILDRKNKQLPIPFQAQAGPAGTFIVPAGQFYVYGTNPRSYDSRYFGLVLIDQLIGKLDPIF